jgi:hypothetical protein
MLTEAANSASLRQRPDTRISSVNPGRCLAKKRFGNDHENMSHPASATLVGKTTHLTTLALAALVLFRPLVTHALLLKDERGRIDIESPADWKYVRNFFGLPHVLLSPEEKEGRRGVLGITLTGKQGWDWDGKTLEKSQSEYREGRKKWATGVQAEIEDFIPYASLKTKGGVEIHAIGVKYRLQSTEMTEMSWYIECPKSFVHAKGVAMSSRPAQLESMRAAVLDLKCAP